MSFLTPAQAAASFHHLITRVFPETVKKPYGPKEKAVFRVLFSVAKEAQERISRYGIGKRIWGANGAWSGGVGGSLGEGSNLPDFVHPTKLMSSGGDYQVGILARGIPALMETGGRTKPHWIDPRAATLKSTRKVNLAEAARYRVRRGHKLLVGGGVLKLADGRFVRYVKEQSAQIPKHPTIDTLLRQNEGRFASEIDQALQTAVNEVIDAAA
jgi:hypothetical protein